MEKIQPEDLASAPVSAREALVLKRVVEDYIAHGAPVASQSIAGRQHSEGMSPATVRNVMADLSEAGYLEQPHTSAGRIPTARAFRYYVEQLLQQTDSAALGLPQPAQERIEDTFAGVLNATDFFARTPHILALLSGAVGVALTTPGGVEMLEHIHFARLGRTRVLTVLVSTTGRVRDRLLTLGRDWTTEELVTAANYLNRNFHRWPIDRIRPEIIRRIQLERGEYDRILRSLDDLWVRGAMEIATEPTGGGDPEDADGSSPSLKDPTVRSAPARSASEKSIFVEGVANLMVNEVDREHLRRILMALEEKQRVIDLLNAYIDGHDTSVRVVVGLEEAMPEMRDLALVAAPARRGREHLGTVAVIGPTRMQYASTIGTVTYIADLFGRWAEQ